MSVAPLTDRGRRTREALLVAARRVFEERGYNAARMGDIAEAAGVSHGTVYTWFATKDRVLRALVDGMVDELYASMRTPEGTDPIERIDLANRRYLDGYRAHARLLAAVEEAATTDDEFRILLTDLRRTHVERVAATIRRLAEDGVARSDLDPQAAAAALCAMVEGFARHWFGRGEVHDEEVAVATVTALWVASLHLDNEMPARPAGRGR